MSLYDFFDNVLILIFNWCFVKKLGIKVPIEPCSIKDLNRPASRPLNCLLENRRLKKQGMHIMLDWKEDLDVFLDKFGNELIKRAKMEKG